jgi:ubiquinone/menaquinone biosynthesis C-methylase UbiE
MSYLTRRRLTPERMDDPNADRADLADSLAYLRGINRKLGGVGAVLNQLDRWSRDWPSQGSRPIRILDVGTGSADIPLAIAEWARQRRHRVHITGIDLHPATVAVARKEVEKSREQIAARLPAQDAPGAREANASLPSIAILQADALKLMDIFQPGEFDYAHAGLFLHHLSDVEVMTALKIMDRLAARGVIWNDLVRGWAGRIGVRLLTMSSRVPSMARHDAIASVRAGFTKREAMDLAKRAGLANLTFRTHRLYRFTLVSEKRG